MSFVDFSTLRAASKAEAAAASAPAPVAPAAPAAAAPAPAAPAGPLFLGDAVRSRTFPLDYPLAYEGRTYSAIVLARPTSRQVGEFFEVLFDATSVDPKALVYFPVFFDEDGEPIPPAVLDALDDDDRTPIMQRIVDFLPRRLLALRGAGDRASGSDAGENTAPTS